MAICKTRLYRKRSRSRHRQREDQNRWIFPPSRIRSIWLMAWRKSSSLQCNCKIYLRACLGNFRPLPLRNVNWRVRLSQLRKTSGLLENWLIVSSFGPPSVWASHCWLNPVNQNRPPPLPRVDDSRASYWGNTSFDVCKRQGDNPPNWNSLCTATPEPTSIACSSS